MSFFFFLLHARDLCKDWRRWAQDANFCHHVLSTVQRLGCQSHDCCKDWRRRIGVSTKSLSFFFIRDSLQRLETLGLGLQFLPCSVVYSAKTAKIGLSVRVVVAKIGDDGPRTPFFAITCYLRFARSVHVVVASLGRQFLASRVIYSAKRAKIGLSVRVVVAKIGDDGPRTPFFAITCYLRFGRSVHVVVAKIGDAGPRTPIFGVTCYLQREACKDWPASPHGRCEDWGSWAQDIYKIWRPGPSMTKVLYLIWNYVV